MSPGTAMAVHPRKDGHCYLAAMRTARPRAAVGLAVCALTFLTASPAHAATLPSGFGERTLASGLTRPTAVAWAPDGRMFIAEKDGRVRVMDANGALQPNPVIDIHSTVNPAGDRGLLGLAVDSDYANPSGAHRYLYLLYTYESDPSRSTAPKASQLLRVVVNPDNSLGARTPILGTRTSAPCPNPPTNASDCIPSDSQAHSIGTVRSDPDGTLWVGSGDGSSYGGVDQLAFRTYNEASYAGKILHVDRNGSGLTTHPFCPSDPTLTDVCTKLYAKGFRNPFRFTLRSGGLGPVVGDVGWNNLDELDLLASGGGDYGWPCFEANSQTPGYSSDVKCSGRSTQLPDYQLSHADGGVAIVGGPTDTGSDFPVGYRGTSFFGDYGSGVIRRYDPSSRAAIDFATGAGPWVDLEAAPAGLSYARPGDLVYVDVGDLSSGTGAVGRILYTTGNQTPIARATGSPTAGDPPLTVAFRGDSSSDPDGDSLSYSWTFGDGSTSTAQNPSHQYATRGGYTARLTVSDGRGSASQTVAINVGAPVVSIASPTSTLRFRDGRPVGLEGSATAFGGQPIPDSGMSWNVILHHSASHIHNLGTFAGGSASFTPLTDHDADSWYDVTLTATDAYQASASQKVTIYPQTVTFGLASSPAGAPVTYAGTNQTAPFTTSSAVGFQTSASAAAQFTTGGNTYVFSSWSDGQAPLHDVTIPSTDTTLTAVYTQAPAPLAAVTTAGTSVIAAAPKDGTGPSVSVALSRGSLRRGHVTGTASDPSNIKLVEVALRSRSKSRGKCRWWSSRSRSLRAASRCSRPRWMTARLSPVRADHRTRPWTVDLRRALPRGRYVLLVHAVDGAGNSTSKVGKATEIPVKM